MHSTVSEPRTLVHTLNLRAQHTPNALAYLFLGDGERESGRQTFGELDASARRVAAALRARVRPRERVLLLYSDGLDFVIAFFGCLYAGVIPVPAYPPMRGKRLAVCADIARNCRASAALTTSDQAPTLHKALSQNAWLARLPLLTTDDCGGAFEAYDPGATLAATSEFDVAFIQYTSGATGTPKGVIVTHGSLLNNERAIARAFGHDERTVFVGWLPLFHDMGLIGNVLQPLHLGIPAILMPPAAFLQKPVRWLQAISRYRGTSSGAPNFAYELCAARITQAQKAALDLSSWSLAFNGAEPLQPATLRRFSEAFAPCGFDARAHYPCYGLAEATLFAAGGQRGQLNTISVDATLLEQHRVERVDPTHANAKHLVACGASWLGNELCIVDPETRAELGDDSVGEIWMSGPSVTAGYWANPERTRATFQARLENERSSDRRHWLRTGDLGFRHSGQLYFTGRLQDMIVIDGRYLYPQDIELAAERSHPHVARGRVAAFVSAKCELAVCAEVDFAARAVAKSQLLVEAIRAAIAEQYAISGAQVRVLQPSTLPITSSGKVRRRACRELYQNDELVRFGVASPRTTVRNASAAKITSVFVREAERLTGVG